MKDLEAKERIEIEIWKNSATESPDADSLEVIAHKFSESRVFLANINAFHDYFARASTILELGGGQCWGSCIVKRKFPDAKVYASDISEFAVASAAKWEHLLHVKVDKTFACKSYDIPLEASSVDLVFAFSAAHHFAAHRKTLKEIYRVLTPGGVCLYLREPSCRPYLYRLAHRRVNLKRPEVPEDVLIRSELVRLAQEVGFISEAVLDPSTVHRGAAETVYYLGLQKLPLLKDLLPCTANFIFQKNEMQKS